MRKILILILLTIPLCIYAQMDLFNFAADHLGVNKNVVQGAEMIGGLYNLHRSSNNYQVNVENITNLNVNIKDPQALLDDYNRKLSDLNAEVEELKRKKEKELNDIIDKIAQTAKELADKANISTGNGMADLLIGGAAKIAAKEVAKASMKKKVEEEKARIKAEIDAKLKSTMGKIKEEIMRDNTNAKNEYLKAAANCFFESDESYFLNNLVFHDCVIKEIEKNYDWTKADWIKTSCSAPSRTKSFSTQNEKGDYMSCAKRKFKIYHEQFPDQSFLESSRKFTESALAENPKNAEAYAFLAYIEKDIIEKYKFISFALYLNPNNNKIAEEKKITAFHLSKQLFESIKNNNIDFVKRITDLKFHYGLVDRDKNNPIAAAVNSDKPEILNVLLASYKNPEINEIFFYAVARESNLCIKKLLDLGVDISKLSENLNGQPLLFIAASKKNQGMASLFLEKNVNIDLSLNYAKAKNSNLEYKTMLLYIMDKAIEKSNIDYFNKVIKLYPEIGNEPRENADNYFQYAIKMNSKNIVLLFLDNGAQLNAVTSDGRTNLEIALVNNAQDVALALIEKGFDLSVPPSGGGNYINVVSNFSMLNILKALINKQQSSNLVDKKGISPLLNCVNREDVASAEYLINNKANADESGDYGNLMHLAIGCKSSKMLELLISKGVSPDLKNSNGNSALMYAIINNEIEKANLLINYKADLNMQNKDLWNPLNYSAYKEFNDIVKLLIEKGANPNVKNEVGWTPLHFAARNNNREIISLLTTHNADKKAKDKWQRTPLKIADQMKNSEIKTLLK